MNNRRYLSDRAAKRRICDLYRRLGGPTYWSSWEQKECSRWDGNVISRAKNHYPFSGEERRLKNEFPKRKIRKDLNRDFSDGD